MSGRVRRFGNVFVGLLLRSPFHRTLSGSLILISLIVFVGHSEAKTWWRSMPGANVRVHLRGVDLDADARVVKGSSLASAYLARQPRSAGVIAAQTDPVFVRASGLWRASLR